MTLFLHRLARLAAAVAALAFLLALALGPAHAELTFPALTGRVVDQAGILPADVKAAITARLEQLEKTNGDQLVVVTLSTLQGTDIATFGYQLGRNWGIGQAKLNNGALLIVAPSERKVRIEVGYGLEGTLTDALTSVIIQRAILPRFKAGDMPGGIKAGVDQLVDALGSPAAADKLVADNKARPASNDSPFAIFVLFALLAIGFHLFNLRRSMRMPVSGVAQRGRRTGRNANTDSWAWGTGAAAGWASSSSSSSSFDSSSSSSSDSFSGGGGSFGGGGASGDW